MIGLDKAALKRELKSLYGKFSKHSSYQSIPDFVADALDYRVAIDEQWRGDRVRMRHFLPAIEPLAGRQLGDFGANTGFFSLTIAHANPDCEVLAIEANPIHAQMIRRIAQCFGLKNLRVDARPVGIGELSSLPRLDTMLHLNVLHHAGADFDREHVPDVAAFDDYAIRYLGRLHAGARSLVFQMGSNLWGDKQRPLVPMQNDGEKLVLMTRWLSTAGWIVDDIAWAERGEASGEISYRSMSTASRAAAIAGDLSALALAIEAYRLDRHVGEFYRRPLFRCRSPE